MCLLCSIVVDPLFENLNRLQLAHPDPVDEEEEDEDDGMMMTANGLMRVEDHVCNLFAQAAVVFSLLFLICRKNTNAINMILLFVSNRSVPISVLSDSYFTEL